MNATAFTRLCILNVRYGIVVIAGGSDYTGKVN